MGLLPTTKLPPFLSHPSSALWGQNQQEGEKRIASPVSLLDRFLSVDTKCLIISSAETACMRKCQLRQAVFCIAFPAMIPLFPNLQPSPLGKMWSSGGTWALWDLLHPCHYFFFCKGQQRNSGWETLRVAGWEARFVRVTLPNAVTENTLFDTNSKEGTSDDTPVGK